MLRRCYQAEVIKNRRTSAGRLAVALPALVVFLAAALTKDYVVVDCYNWWYIGILPACTALTAGALLSRERRQGSRGILSLPLDLGKIWDGKILYGVRMLAVSMFILFAAALLAWFILKRLLCMEFPVEISAARQSAAALVLFVTSLWQVPFCLFLHQLAGSGAAPLLHVAGYTIMAVTVSLKPYFMFAPGAISARLMCSILGVLPNGLAARPGSATYLPELVGYSAVPAGIFSSLIWFVFFWGAGRWWFGRQVAG